MENIESVTYAVWMLLNLVTFYLSPPLLVVTMLYKTVISFTTNNMLGIFL